MIALPTNRLLHVLGYIALALSLGCSNGDRPPLGEVTGVVTLDGQPAAGLGILFKKDGFRSSSGVTNENGEYELKYIKKVLGAVVGEHKVRIQPLAAEGANRKGRRIPPRYNRESELTATVKTGSNTFNFDLFSDGEPPG